jgi:hypothetical protein
MISISLLAFVIVYVHHFIDKKYMYNIGVGLDVSLLLCLNNGFADLVYFGNNLNYR